MQALVLLVLGRLALPLLAAIFAVIVITFAAYGYIAVLVALAALGYLTEWHVHRRDLAALPDVLIPEHRTTLDDGTSANALEGENAVRPRPTALLAGGRYAAAWSSRPEAVVRVAPPFLKAVLADIAGITLGVALFVLLIVILAARL